MNSLAAPKLFLDTSLIIAATLSESSSSPGRRLFKMGQVALIDLRISNDVLRECSGVLRQLTGEEFPEFQAILAEGLVLSNIATAQDPHPDTVQSCTKITRYLPDARVLAAALESDCEVLVAYDKEHLLRNPLIGPPNTRLVVMSGGEALEWATDQVIWRSRLRLQQNRGRS